jgi:hypothetical protein
MKQQFYLGTDDDIERLKEAAILQKQIAVVGSDTLTGRIRSYAGVVLSVENTYSKDPGERWRITIQAE